MNKYNSIILWAILLLSALGVITTSNIYTKVMIVNATVTSNIATLEEIQADITTQKEELDILYNNLCENIKNIQDEIENVNYAITNMACEEIVLNRWGIELTDEEINLLARIVMLEAGNEPDWGKEAVVEVIFNRIYHEDFPNTLEGVLSEDGQFKVWKNRNIKAATPTDSVYECIDNVLSGRTDILPYETVYFGRSAENDKKETVIGNHVFCNQY